MFRLAVLILGIAAAVSGYPQSTPAPAPAPTAAASAPSLAPAQNAQPSEQPLTATCDLVSSAGQSVAGVIEFIQAGEGAHVVISGTIKGLTPGQHGFHMHRDGNTGDGCKAAGPHFNPHNENHGSPTDDHKHAGDFGNIVADETGTATISLHTAQISLQSNVTNGALDRAIVVHALPDDLGKGNTEESLKTGSAGARVACCIVKLSPQ